MTRDTSAMRRRLALGVVFAGSLISMTSLAHAYRRRTVDDLPEGAPLFWERRSIEFRDEFTRIPNVESNAARLALGASLATWSHAGDCTDIALTHIGQADTDRTNLSGGAPDRENRVVFRATDWPLRVGPQTLAVTTLIYRRASGEIVDADIDVNAVNHPWSALTVPAGTNDIENTLTHEFGHVLGFAHSDVLEATMFAHADLDETLKRDLAPDDLDAVCTVYPPHPTNTCAASSGHSNFGWIGWLAVAWLGRRRQRGC